MKEHMENCIESMQNISRFFFLQIMLIKLTFGSVDKTEVQGEESAAKHHGEDDSRGPEVRDVEI